MKLELSLIGIISYQYIDIKYRIINVDYLKVGFCHVEIQKLCYINSVLRRELKVFEPQKFSHTFLHLSQ